MIGDILQALKLFW